MAQQIHFVTGKGGVGKSTCALGLALALRRQGHRTLLVELSERSYFKELLELPEVTYRPRAIAEGVELARWSGAECLREYAGHLIKVEALAQMFFAHEVSRSLIEIAPALKDLAILGKATSAHRRHGPPLPFDVMVLDSPATGHFLSMMRSPQGMSEAVRFGPMGEQTRSIAESLKDPRLCKYHVVTIPEEMAMAETEELVQGLRPIVGGAVSVILNRFQRIPENLPEGSVHPFFACLHDQKSRQEAALLRLKDIGVTSQVVPRVAGIEASDIAALVAEALR